MSRDVYEFGAVIDDSYARCRTTSGRYVIFQRHDRSEAWRAGRFSSRVGTESLETARARFQANRRPDRDSALVDARERVVLATDITSVAVTS